jgi:hypothetical protein
LVIFVKKKIEELDMRTDDFKINDALCQEKDMSRLC